MRRRDFIRSCAAGVLGLMAPVPKLGDGSTTMGAPHGVWVRWTGVPTAGRMEEAWQQQMDALMSRLCLTPEDIARVER